MPATDPTGDPDEQRPARPSWIERRQAKMREEIARNRRGEYTVPTWVLAVALAAMIGAWLAFIFLVG